MDFLTNQATNAVFFRVLVLLFSVVIHEVSHGAVAYALGDNTAKDAGRLTLNPIPHIDFVGSILMPLFVGIGWAKPVPYNPYNLRSQRWGPLLVGVAGPLSNLLVAGVFGFLIRFRTTTALLFLDPSFFGVAMGIVFLNIALAIFNLLPIPPLDGSKVLFAFLPSRWSGVEAFLERYGILIILVLFLFFPLLIPTIVLPVSDSLFQLFTGASF